MLKKIRGFPDLLSEERFRMDYILSQINPLLEKFNFQKVDPPVLESSELFSRALGEGSDIVHKEMYSFRKDEDNLSLRPEGTAGVARMFITQRLNKNLPLRWYYYGPMFRRERPQKGRFRQFHQLGVEFLGDSTELADVEILSIAWLLVKKLNLEKQVTLEINSLGSLEERRAYKDKLRKFLLPLRNKLSQDSQIRLDKNPLRIWDSKEKQDQELMKKAPLLFDSLQEQSLKKYENLKALLSLLKIPFEENKKLVRGLDYYNDLVFEWTSGNLGSQSAFLAGGRYDRLIEMLGGERTSAVGWALGLERLSLLVSRKRKLCQIALLSLGSSATKKAFQLAYELRTEGFSVYYRFSGNFSKQMKRAGQTSLLALIYGEKEQARGEIILKQLKTGEQFCLPLSRLREELKKQLA